MTTIDKIRDFIDRQSGRASFTTAEIARFKGITTTEALQALRALEKEGRIFGITPTITSWKSGASPRKGTRRWTRTTI